MCVVRQVGEADCEGTIQNFSQMPDNEKELKRNEDVFFPGLKLSDKFVSLSDQRPCALVMNDQCTGHE